MAKNTQASDAAANAACGAITALLNSGLLRIYDGVQPTNGNTALGAQVLLAELTFGATAFAAAVAGVATANAIASDTSANAAGTASWFRCVKSDGTSVVFDGSVGTTLANLNLNATAISAGAQVDVTSLTFSILEAVAGQ
jgi:hypothetical protein